MSLSFAKPQKTLLMGAGDGLAVRELLKDQQIKRIDLIELDKAMINLSKTNPYLKAINENSLDNNKVHIYLNDALSYLKQNTTKYDLIIADFPDPNN